MENILRQVTSVALSPREFQRSLIRLCRTPARVRPNFEPSGVHSDFIDFRRQFVELLTISWPSWTSVELRQSPIGHGKSLRNTSDNFCQIFGLEEVDSVELFNQSSESPIADIYAVGHRWNQTDSDKVQRSVGLQRSPIALRRTMKIESDGSDRALMRPKLFDGIGQIF